LRLNHLIIDNAFPPGNEHHVMSTILRWLIHRLVTDPEQKNKSPGAIRHDVFLT
jgi:hypothetical protein